MACMVGDSLGYLAPDFVPMAHRGGALYAPNLGIENTLTAFCNAWDLGFTYMETDVHATRDGVLMAFHDIDLSRMTGFSGRISQLSFDEVRELSVYGREAIPTMDELLEALPGARFNIDIKEPGAITPLVEAIERHRAHARVCVGSFSLPRLRRFRRLLPTVTTAVSNYGAAALSLRRAKLPGNAKVVFQVPVTHSVRGVTLRIVTPRSIQAVHAAGRKIHVWTIDDAEQMHELIDWGVDGIITDRPDVLKGVLRARGMWSTR